MNVLKHILLHVRAVEQGAFTCVCMGGGGGGVCSNPDYDRMCKILMTYPYINLLNGCQINLLNGYRINL